MNLNREPESEPKLEPKPKPLPEPKPLPKPKPELEPEPEPKTIPHFESKHKLKLNLQIIWTRVVMCLGPWVRLGLWRKSGIIGWKIIRLMSKEKQCLDIGRFIFFPSFLKYEK